MPRPVLLIAGGSRGIGASTCKLAGARGYDVAVNYKSNAKRAAGVVDAVKAAGGKAIAIQGDMVSEETVERVFDEAAKALGPITHFVHSAGDHRPVFPARCRQRADDARSDRRQYRTARCCVCAPAVRRMSTKNGGKGGSVVMLSSMASVIGGAGEYVWYAAAKGGIDALTIGVSREVAKEGVRVNAIRPGPIDTDIQPPGRLERVGTPLLPMGRPGQPDEIAEAIMFLLSDDASYITGAVLNVSGGR